MRNSTWKLHNIIDLFLSIIMYQVEIAMHNQRKKEGKPYYLKQKNLQ